MQSKTILIEPVAKPRMTRSDKWKARPAVARYRQFCDLFRLHKAKIKESGTRLTFVMAMPVSWSEKKKAEMDGKPHKQKPDIDNLCKACLDALFEDDSHIWDIHARKIWGKEPMIIIQQED